MRTLALMAEDMEDVHLPVVLASLLPMLLSALIPGAGGSLPPVATRQALAVVTSCVASAAMMEADTQKQLHAVVVPALPMLVPALCALLSAPISQDDSRCVSLMKSY